MHENLITIILVAIVLGMDAFSLSLGMGLRGVTQEIRSQIYQYCYCFTYTLCPLLV